MEKKNCIYIFFFLFRRKRKGLQYVIIGRRIYNSENTSVTLRFYVAMLTFSSAEIKNLDYRDIQLEPRLLIASLFQNQVLSYLERSLNT